MVRKFTLMKCDSPPEKYSEFQNLESFAISLHF